MNTTAVLDLWMVPVSLRRAWDISRAWRPTWVSPMSPSISACGTRAATLSTTIASMAPLRTSCSVMSRACSALSGWAMSSSSKFRPQLAA